MEKYRISKNRDEIIKLVQKKFEAENLITIWQKNPKTGLRSFKCDVKLASFDAHEGIFSVNIDEEQNKSFDPKLETYFLLQVQDFVFKTKISTIHPAKKGSINFIIPLDVRLKEHRLNPRLYIEAHEKRFVSVKFASKQNEKATVEVLCPVYNISRGGICIIISKETLSTVKLDKPISLEGLSFFELLENEMKAAVKNAREFSKKSFESDESYALGLEFLNTPS